MGRFSKGFRVPAGNNKKSGGCVAVIFGLLFACGGLVFLVVMGKMWFAEAKSRTWDKTPCTIELCEVTVTESDDDRPFELDVRYGYVFDGRNFTSETMALQGKSGHRYEKLSLKRRKILNKAEPVCYVNSKEPTEAVLERGSILLHTLMLLFPLPFLGIGLTVLWFGARAIRSRGVDEDEAETASISANAKTSKAAGRWVAVAFFGVFLIIGLIVTYLLAVGPVLKARAAKSWVEAPCEIVWSKVRRHDGDSDSGPTYSVDIFYRYDFDGFTGHSNTYNFSSSGSFSGRSGKKAIVQRYPRGSQHVCYVNPDILEKAVLERRLGKSVWIGLIPGVFVLIGLGGIIYTLRSPKKSDSAQALSSSSSIDSSIGPLTLRPTGSRWKKVAGFAAICLFWNGIVSVFLYQVIQGWQQGNPSWFETLFLTPFVIIGLLMILGFVHALLGLLNPKITVTLGAHPVRPGDTLKLSWKMRGINNRLQKLTVAVEAEESATYRRGTSTHTDSAPFYHHIVFQTSSRLEMHTGFGECALPVHLPPNFDSGNNKITWKVHVLGDIPWWPDVDDSYDIDVIPK